MIYLYALLLLLLLLTAFVGAQNKTVTLKGVTISTASGVPSAPTRLRIQ